MYINKIIFIVFLLLDVFDLSAQSKKDSILGSNNELRSWWDVKHYSITIRPDFKTKSIKGLNDISFILLNKKSNELQLDLQSPMKIDSVFCNSIKLNSLISNGNFWILNVPSLKIDTIQHLKVYFSGLPRVAKNAPWDGGWVWKLDSNKNPWMSVACQGAGASVWYPCKDLQSDEPENGAELNIQVPDTLVGIGNGQLQSILKLNNGYTQYSWKVINTINSYNIVPYIGIIT
jgi:aminopeptidase N